MSTSQKQGIRGRDPKKKTMQKENSIKVVAYIDAPNQAPSKSFVNSTSESLAEKEEFRVTSPSSSSSSSSTPPSTPSGNKPDPKSKASSFVLRPVKPSMKKNSALGRHPTMSISRSTCSSAMKDSRKREASDPHEAELKVCPYRYCSFHDNGHKAAFPLLRWQSMKENSTIRGRVHGEMEAAGDLADIVSRMNDMTVQDDADHSVHQESISVTSFEDYTDNNSELSEEEAGGGKEAGSIPKPSLEKKEGTEDEKETNPLLELTNMPKTEHGVTRSGEQEKERNPREFNPTRPRFLPWKAASEAESVNLKHHPAEERKAAEEWMIDYALRKALVRLAPARRRKVSLLVAAFESVMPQKDGLFG